MSRPDIRQVAAEAGVSTATVSRVLSGRGPASAAAIAKVQAAADRLGYSPSASARSLRTERSRIIGVLVPNLANPVFLPFLRAVDHLAGQHGFAVIVADTQRTPAIERRQLDRLSSQRVDALIVAGRPSDADHLRQLADDGLLVADAEEFAAEAGLLAASLGEAIDGACAHLAQLGHHRIALVARGRALRETGDARWHLIEAGCFAHGLEPTRVMLGSLLDGALLDGEQLADVVDGLVRTHGGVTALWSASHALAPHLLEGLARADLDIPGDCSFLTFGDSPWTLAYRPSISVVTGDLAAIATTMTRWVLEQLGVTGLPEGSVEPDVYLARDSVGPSPIIR